MNDRKPLTGKRIAVTRARHQAPPLEALIRDFGGAPVAYPCIAIAPPTDPRPLEDCLRRLSEFDWLLLTSGNTVSAIADRLSALDIRLADKGIRVAAAGAATAAEARAKLARRVQHVPAEYGAGQLARSLPLGEPCRILLPQSDLASASTAALLRARGAQVTTVIAYRTIMADGEEDLPAMISRRELDALTFTSPSAVAFFRRRCPSSAALLLPAACIGRSTSAAAREHGFDQLIKPDQATLRDMIAALASYWAASWEADRL